MPSLLVRDLRETLDFYEQVLDFRVTGLNRGREDSTWAEVSRSGVVLQFHSSPPRGTPREPILSGTLYIFPESVSDLAAELAGRVAFEWGPEVMEYGMREFALRDPNGYFLAFTEPV